MKNKWVQPELTVLVRSKPEEAVLQACKHWGLELSGFNDTHLMCCETCAEVCYAQFES
jgi:hypothetical protein